MSRMLDFGRHPAATPGRHEDSRQAAGPRLPAFHRAAQDAHATPSAKVEAHDGRALG